MTATAPETDVVEIEVEVPPGEVLTYDHRRLLSAFSAYGITDPSCIAIETDGSRRALITLYKRPPLDNVRPARPDDLVMDAQGYITVGVYHDGRPARERLYMPGSGAQRSAMFGTTGAGKSRALHLRLAAQKRSRIVSWTADLKSGQSVPEARDNVDWFVTTQEGAILMLLSAVLVAEDRMRRYAQAGRSAFLLGAPDPLHIVRIDEANRLLEPGAPYRKAATYLIRELGRTGRSVGVGVGLAAQAGHLAELGGSDTLRAMLKEGETTLLRWSSGMMQSLVADGLLPEGTRLAAIPKYNGGIALQSRFTAAEQHTTQATTAGMAYLLGSPRPSALMRHFRVGSPGPVDGLDPAILDLYGPGEPARLEDASHRAAGAFYRDRWNGEDFDGLAEILAALADGAPIAEVPLPDTIPTGPAHAPQPPATPNAPRTPTIPGPPRPATGRTGKPTTASRVLAVLTDGPLSKRDIITAVNADGGRELSSGTISNTLNALKDKGKVTCPERGVYQLPDTNG